MDEGNDEEGHTKKDYDGGDDVNEVFDFFGNWCLSTLEARSEASNPSHHRVVTDVDHHPDAGAFHGVGGEEANVLSFQGILVGKFWAPSLRLRLSSERGVVDLETPTLDHPDISGDSVAKLDLDNISEGQLLGFHRDLLSVPSGNSVLRDKVLESFHDLCRL